MAGDILEFYSTGSNELRRYPAPFPITRLLDLGDALLASGVHATSRGEPPMLLHLWEGTFDRGGFFAIPTFRVPAPVVGTYGFTPAPIRSKERRVGNESQLRVG